MSASARLAALYAQLQAASTPDETRNSALQLLTATFSRQYIDAALHALRRPAVRDCLKEEHRAPLRQKALHYFEAPPEKDKGGWIRESIFRLLVEIGSPDDLDLYLRGVEVYHHQPILDSAQNLRAASLAGLAVCDQSLACAYATKLLGEEDTSQLNCEPSITAINVLQQFGQLLPIYQFVLLRGRAFLEQAKGEAVARAIEVLDERFPTSVFCSLADDVIQLNAPQSSSAVLENISVHHRETLYPLIEQVISHTRHDDLRRYAVIMLAASRDETQTTILFDLAKHAKQEHVPHFIEALELTLHPHKEEILSVLRRRAGK